MSRLVLRLSFALSCRGYRGRAAFASYISVLNSVPCYPTWFWFCVRGASLYTVACLPSIIACVVAVLGVAASAPSRVAPL